MTGSFLLRGAVLALLAVPLIGAEPTAGEDRCADARRTCEAWCEENRGPDGTCRADCWKRYKQCKRTGWFIWGGLDDAETACKRG